MLAMLPWGRGIKCTQLIAPQHWVMGSIFVEAKVGFFPGFKDMVPYPPLVS